MVVDTTKLLDKFIKYSDILGELDPNSFYYKKNKFELENLESRILDITNFVIHYHMYKNKTYRFIRKHFNETELHFSVYKQGDKIND